MRPNTEGECPYIHRCLYDGDQQCQVRLFKLPVIQANLDAAYASSYDLAMAGTPVGQLTYKMVYCRNCEIDRQEAELERQSA